MCLGGSLQRGEIRKLSIETVGAFVPDKLHNHLSEMAAAITPISFNSILGIELLPAGLGQGPSWELFVLLRGEDTCGTQI